MFPIERAHRDQLRALGGYWYLASPYTNYPDGHETACELACKAAMALMERGARVFSPIAHSHTVAQYAGINPSDHQFWLDQDGPLLRGAHGLIVYKMPGWKTSKGVQAEIKYMKGLNKPVMSMEVL